MLASQSYYPIILSSTIRKLELKINLFLLKYPLPIIPSLLLAIKKLKAEEGVTISIPKD